MDVDLGLFGDLRESWKSDLLQQHEEDGQAHVAAIKERAKKEGIEVSTNIAAHRQPAKIQSSYDLEVVIFRDV